MPSDIKLNDGSDRTWVTIETSTINTTASELILDAQSRRSANGGSQRRALVHDQDDGLTVNFDGDYPAGVTINGARLRLKVHEQESETPKLPKSAEIGEIVLVKGKVRIPRPDGGFEPPEDKVTLWLCTGVGPIGPDAWWSPISIGDGTPGTE